jgi:hypothetical protein
MPLTDIELSWYSLKFDVAFLSRTGVVFQDWFNDIMEHAHGSTFTRIRPYGNQGDGKCDGRLIANGQRVIFQCYAPEPGSKDAAWLKKIDIDFAGALVEWPGQIDLWTFVHNAARGVSPKVAKRLEELDRQHEPIRVNSWGKNDLRNVTLGLQKSSLIHLFGSVFSAPDLVRLGYDTIRPMLTALRSPWPESDDTIRPVPVDKLDRNDLSDAARTLLAAGRKGEKVVQRFLDESNDPSLGEAVATRFRHEYRSLVGQGLDADTIFRELLVFTHGDGVPDPKEQVGGLAIMSYLFERCDIFENPDTSERE